ncbi:hypothetical protein JHK85_025709 [Glycine max]|nr:hypothetical protein JHK85_025709 [Glycine max]KAG5012949.1 hypothetical protein JHK86_025210 [Glycine max]
MSLTDGDLDLRPPSKSSFTVGEYMFADVENLEHYAKYLNQSLITFGFPASLDLFTNDPVRSLIYFAYCGVLFGWPYFKMDKIMNATCFFYSHFIDLELRFATIENY